MLRPPGRARRVLILGGEGAIVALAALLLAYPILHLRNADMHVPFVYLGDANFYASLVKNIAHEGWFLHNPHLGFPFGQQLFDFPQSNDQLHFFVLKLLTMGSSSYALVLNVFYLATYPLDAVVAHFVLRAMGRRPLTSAVFALLFAYLPYHLFRSESHLMLVTYEAVPLGVLLLWWTFREEPLLFAGWNRRAIGALVIAVVLGAINPYYAVFAALPLGVLALAGILAKWDWRRWGSAVVVAGVIAVSAVGNAAPSLLYWHSHGENRVASSRNPLETEYFGLKLAQLVLPVPGHHIGALAHAEAKSANPIEPSETGQNIGIIGSIGFAVLLVWTVLRIIGRRRDTGADEPPFAPLSFATLILALTGTIGGFSLILALGGFTQIRSWNRVSLVIAFCSFAALAWLVDVGVTRVRPRFRDVATNPVLYVAVVIAVLVVGLWDETTPVALPNYAAFKAEFARDKAFVGGIEARMPKGAAIYQLPVMPFPEAGPLHDMVDYDPLRGFLQSRDLNWSYGAVKGRQGVWLNAAGSLPTKELVPALVGAGFTGIYLDSAGYTDAGKSQISELTALVGAPTLMSTDNRFSFFDLRQYAQTALAARGDAIRRAGRVLLHPVEVRAGRGAKVVLHNPLGDGRHVTVNFGSTAVPMVLRHGDNVATMPSPSQPGIVAAPVTVTDDAIAAAAS